MEPRITEGDVVIVRQQEDAESGETVIVLINGEDATCKRLKNTLTELCCFQIIPNMNLWFFLSRKL